MTLFTKPDCEKCEYIKKLFDLKAMGVKVEAITKDDPEALAHLAWHESVSTAEKLMPILVLDDMSVVAGALKIKKVLEAINGNSA